MITIGEKVEPLIKLLREELLDSSYLHMDETVVQVLNEEGKKAQSTSYMWVQARSGPKPIILFHYAKNRSAMHSEELLEDFSGYLHVDGYDGYAPICKKNQITRLGCWAHARRKFFDAFKSSQGNIIGKQGLVFFKKLYEVEDKIRELPPAEKLESRQSESLKIANDFKEWVDEKISKTTPKSIGGSALGYVTNEWKYLLACFSKLKLITISLKVTFARLPLEEKIGCFLQRQKALLQVQIFIASLKQQRPTGLSHLSI